MGEAGAGATGSEASPELAELSDMAWGAGDVVGGGGVTVLVTILRPLRCTGIVGEGDCCTGWGDGGC